MMEVALYLLPVTLGETPVENVLPVYNKEVILGIKHFKIRLNGISHHIIKRGSWNQWDHAYYQIKSGR